MAEQVLRARDGSSVVHDIAAQGGDGEYGVRVVPTYTLTERLMAKAPATDYALWLDTEDASYLYILEAPVATLASETGFRGIRITVSASGNPVGKVEINTAGTLTFDNRTTDLGWS